MRRLIGGVLLLLFALLWLLPGTGLAAPAPRILAFKQKVMKEADGTPYLHCEIGFSDAPQFTVKAGGLLYPTRVLIDLPGMSPGDMDPEIELKGKKFARLLEINEAAGHTFLTFTTVGPAVDESCRTMLVRGKEQSQLKLKAPFILMVDLFDGPYKPVDRVDGVQGHIIVLDPGHGGLDTGAIGPDGLMEKDVTLAVSTKLRDILEASGAKVAMTRTDDRDVYPGGAQTDGQELQARVDVGDATPGAEIFVSVHCDAFTHPKANGTGTFYYPKTWEDAALAQALQNGMVARGGRRDRGIKEARFYVVRNSDMPAALVELAFITNYVEQAMLADDDFQRNLALGIAEGIRDFFAARR
ncbi:MAG: N-acetylmuramoyl-L-alanine amidase [Schwartzia sp.]|nr:N-acetylmuramoyl-L-alanine amidase [Schwartzia sp. (in: firmicutes)]